MEFGLLFSDIFYIGQRSAESMGMRQVLQAAGYVVRGGEWPAVEAEGWSWLQPLPDLILLALPAEMEAGWALIRRLKSHPALRLIPVLVIGGQSSTADVASTLDAGADDFLPLPLDNVLLLLRVRTMLRLRASTEALEELNATLEQKVQDRTQQLEVLYHQLRHAEKLSALGRLAASIAHEISNPLTGINTYLYLLKEEVPADSFSRQSLEVIEREVGRINVLTRQLRSFSRPPQEQRAPVSLNEVLEHVLLLIDKNLRENKITLSRDFAVALPLVSAAADQLEQVFLNLMLNARDAMPEGGRLTLRTFPVEGGVRVEVSDTGTGIAPEIMDRIFEPFFTTKVTGTGLGLAISYSIIGDHRGKVSVTSEVGRGTTFAVWLPF